MAESISDTIQVISSFSGNLLFMSTDYMSPVAYRGRLWPSISHAYSGSKTKVESECELILDCRTPAAARELGRSKKITLRADWHSIKLGIMRTLIQRKFLDTSLSLLLMLTSDSLIVYENSRNDTFWGICDGKGENHLGNLLMTRRYSLIQRWQTMQHKPDEYEGTFKDLTDTEFISYCQRLLFKEQVVFNQQDVDRLMAIVGQKPEIYGNKDVSRFYIRPSQRDFIAMLVKQALLVQQTNLSEFETILSLVSE